MDRVTDRQVDAAGPSSRSVQLRAAYTFFGLLALVLGATTSFDPLGLPKDSRPELVAGIVLYLGSAGMVVPTSDRKLSPMQRLASSVVVIGGLLASLLGIIRFATA